MFSVIAQANMRFGGSLGEILSHLATTISDQSRMQREFEAMTAEIRTSAKVLVGLPFVVIGAVLIANPNYLMFFVNDPQGANFVIAAAAFALTGLIVLRRLSRVEV